MVADSDAIHGTAFTISVDYRHGTTTGISATTAPRRSGRWRTAMRPRRFRPSRSCLSADRQGWRRPDALGPYRGGDRPLPLAEIEPVAAICELVNDDGT